MSTIKQQYIDAVTELLQNGSEVKTVLDGLTRILKAKGHTSLHEQILVGVQKKLEDTGTESISHIAVAKEGDVEALKTKIEATLQEIGGNIKTATIATDTTLIGGYTATHQGKHIDASHKNKLIKLYRTITA